MTSTWKQLFIPSTKYFNEVHTATCSPPSPYCHPFRQDPVASNHQLSLHSTIVTTILSSKAATIASSLNRTPERRGRRDSGYLSSHEMAEQKQEKQEKEKKETKGQPEKKEEKKEKPLNEYVLPASLTSLTNTPFLNSSRPTIQSTPH